MFWLMFLLAAAVQVWGVAFARYVYDKSTCKFDCDMIYHVQLNVTRADSEPYAKLYTIHWHPSNQQSECIPLYYLVQLLSYNENLEVSVSQINKNEVELPASHVRQVLQACAIFDASAELDIDFNFKGGADLIPIDELETEALKETQNPLGSTTIVISAIIGLMAVPIIIICIIQCCSSHWLRIACWRKYSKQASRMVKINTASVINFYEEYVDDNYENFKTPPLVSTKQLLFSTNPY